MPRQALVDKRVIGIQQIQHTAVFPNNGLEEQLCFPAERLPEVVVKITEHLRFWHDVIQIPKVKPLSRKIVHQRLPAGVE